MDTSTGTEPRLGTVRPELRPLVEGVGFVPARCARDDMTGVRKALKADGAAILTGWAADRDSIVIAAATILGTDLRGLEVLDERTTEDTARTHGAPSPGLLHRDGHRVAIRINGRIVEVRYSDPDYPDHHVRRPSAERWVISSDRRLAPYREPPDVRARAA